MMRARTALLLLLLGVGIAGCGRKDFPDYPPDAVERPGSLQRRNEPVRYY
jgi:predicted small lipoprotein YifL